MEERNRPAWILIGRLMDAAVLGLPLLLLLASALNWPITPIFWFSVIGGALLLAAWTSATA